MRGRYVVDTNVLIAASAADPNHPVDIAATPTEPELRLKIWEWLDCFQKSDSRLVLDTEQKIFSEYNNKLNHSDFGIQVVIHKWSTCAVDDVIVDYDADGHGVLPGTLTPVIHDLADRKMVAAALMSYNDYDEGCVAFAGDTDWHDWEGALSVHNILLEPIIEEWSRARHEAKRQRNGGSA